MMKRKIIAISIFCVPLLFGLFFLVSSNTKTSALSGSQFNAGNIISDSLFYNGNTMSSTQIQSFLDSKVPSCDTNGAKPYGGTTRKAYAASKGVSTPFICLKNKTENTPLRSAKCILR